MNKTRLNSSVGITLIVVAAVSWGLSAVIFIPNLYNLPVAFVVFLQNFISLALMSALFPKEYSGLTKLPGKTLFFLSLIALFSGVIGTLAIVKALFLVNFKQLSVVVLIQKIQPVFTVIIAFIFLKEKLSKNFIFWSLLVFFGVYLLTFGFQLPDFSMNRDHIIAYLLSIISAMSFSTNTILGKYLSGSISFLTITFNRFLFATIFSLIACLVTGTLFYFNEITLSNYAFFAGIVLIGGPPSMFIYYMGLKYVRAMVSAICEMALPFSVIILDYFINHNSLSLIQWIGALIIIFGILKVSGPSSKQTTEKTGNGK